ncbi:hypothetical protein FH966_14815 [Lentibacillus cibarius]|uniref:Uncharacterized protein n=1 Tax=Lentibacillus cibarius TaxID=2583219 RepID=A0A549YA90_9BACI|nr:hypothetical protein [Lentibacillus cibarius]TRM08772.1 hypothetical protein FH966_16480 [Lentibacillus cibarius]TRM08800.1 hypothetical protein FH966_16630 [Lentibacillus cibarius]TRM12874.1 hypothetical protein FH966_14815 [Lentibacillus cibarius]
MKNVTNLEKKQVLRQIVDDLQERGLQIDYASTFFFTVNTKNAAEMQGKNAEIAGNEKGSKCANTYRH